MVEGLRTMRPGLPIVRLLPTFYDADIYPSRRPHAPAVAAARQWCRDHAIPGVEADPLVVPGPNNPDGMHWGWPTHRRVGRALAAQLAEELTARTQEGARA
jgi:hypothetical protein